MQRIIIYIALITAFLVPFNVFAYGTDYRYENKPFDVNTQLYDFNARQYNPNIGQFIQTDTYLEELLLKGAGGNDPELQRLLANPQLLNQRSFKNNNVINYIDPTGKTAVPVDAVLDPMFISDSYNNMQTKHSTWSEIKFGMDSVLLAVPFLPMITTIEKTGEGVKGSAKSINKLINSVSDKIGQLFNKISSKLFRKTESTITNVSEEATDVLKYIESKGYKATLPGYRGGKIWNNELGDLPIKSEGYYKEWDVLPKVSGIGSGEQRLITGQGGEVWYTSDHYKTFTQIRDILNK